MGNMEFFKTLRGAVEFMEQVAGEGVELKFSEGYKQNDDISPEEYENTREKYHGWFVWYNAKPMLAEG